jgi:RNA polymerase sigma factor (sigma-70 family)
MLQRPRRCIAPVRTGPERFAFHQARSHRFVGHAFGSTSARSRFEALVRTVAEPLRRFLVRRTDADTADDVLAETLLVLWRRIDEVPGFAPQQTIHPDEVLPWCYGVARGCLANAQRSLRRRALLKERLRRMSLPLPTDSADHSSLHQALNTLRALDREVLLLWAWEELAPRHIAQVTGLTPNAVSIRLHRAKKKLAAQLERKSQPADGHETDEEGSDR